MKEKLICISCPRGCSLEVTGTGENLTVTGNFCPKGKDYGLQEVVNPVRVLTVLMRPEGAEKPISVKTDRPVPKSMLKECAHEIYRTHPALPVKAGDIVMENILGTGSNVIATCDAHE